MHGMTIERHTDGTVVCMAPIVVKYLNERVEPPVSEERTILHGNDSRMVGRKEATTERLRMELGR